MRFDIHFYHHHCEADAVLCKLNEVLGSLASLKELIMTDLSKLQAAVEKQTTVTQSAITLIEGLAQAIRDLPANQAAINELADKVEAQAQSLSDAITANTPTP